MEIFSKEMNRDYLKQLQSKSWYPKIEKLLLRGDPPSVVRQNLEKAGMKPADAHTLVKNLWNLQNAKQMIKSDDEIVKYLEDHGVSQHQGTDEFCPLQLAIGALVEFEHTDDFDAALEIAKDHLAEDAGYYGEPQFKDEAIERINSVDPDFYEESEALESHKGWRGRFMAACSKALLKSSKNYLHLGPLCIYSSENSTGDDLVSDGASVQFNVNGKSIWVSGENGDVEILTPDERIYVEPEDRSLPLEYMISEYTGYSTDDIVPVVSSVSCEDDIWEEVDDDDEVTSSFVVPIRIPHQIASMSMKQTEDYFKSGLLTRKEVIAVLTRENGWSDEEANQIADFWERCFSSMALVKVGYSDRTGFVPQSNIYSSVAADILSSLDTTDPKKTLLSYASEAWDMEPVKSDRAPKRNLQFTAYDYYKKAEVIPTYKDFVGYLRYTGEFEDYKQAFTDWKSLCKKLDPIDGDDD